MIENLKRINSEKYKDLKSMSYTIELLFELSLNVVKSIG